MTQAVEVKPLAASDAGRWDAFVRQADTATFFHLSGWRDVIERSFGHRTYFVYAERDGAVVGVLPLVHVNSLLFGNALVSLSFAVYGGPVAQDEQVRGALDTWAIDQARRLKAQYLEYRSLRPEHPTWPSKDQLYATFRKALSDDHDANMKAIPRKQRAMVRKGIKAGLTSVLDDDVDRMHHVYAVSVRNLGTPVFPKAYFRNLKAQFGDDCQVLTVEQDGAAVASVLSFFFRGEVLPYYGGSVPEARAVAGNDFMYWEVMRRAVDQGCTVFDFGRSKVDTGAYAFKKHWGFEPTPLHYEYQLFGADAVPDVNPLNPKYRLFIAAWKRMPLPLTKFIGPFIVKNLG